ncbi:phospholipid methyltransferase [Dendrothele bispora CBS 962.96]|uniref:Phosphatidyl-N-methylethanolamine N-methyltransferase n=1 Tax=Dendrothele bispora (strain CBS 962.96) TaxID=1314807 RepID=A0A4S8KNZ6_DENBC|nr:phospholipid methyltransferase [Dendrothele bispora CBS 962.96]
MTKLLKFVLLASYVDWTKGSLYVSLVSITASPLLWNVVARNEYRNKTLTKRMGARSGCTALGVTIFVAGLYREVLYKKALHDQAQFHLPYGIQTVAAWIIFGIGNFLVFTSFVALGFYGTYLGDHFGILKEQRVTQFPFNVLDDPMYVGSTLCFVGAALWYERPVGLLVSLYVAFTYYVALKFEKPFTNMIYENRNRSAKSKHW